MLTVRYQQELRFNFDFSKRRSCN